MRTRSWVLAPDARPLLVGMSPARDEPVFNPDRTNSSGDRLFRMMERRSGLDRTRIRDLFHWDNLVQQGLWDPSVARIGAGEVSYGLTVRPRTVIAVGDSVRQMLHLTVDRPLKWQRAEEGFDYAFVPHPSGRNRWFNDDRHVAATELFFESLILRALDVQG